MPLHTVQHGTFSNIAWNATRLAAMLWATFAAQVPVSADVFQLADGGSISGQLLKRGEDGEYFVQTTTGAQITLAEDQVADVQRQTEFQAEYERRSRALPDTVAAHRSMATWCKQHHLSDLEDHHLRRILDLDPDDQQARTSLGYQRFHGKWLTREELMAERGLTFYDGSYRTAQDIALREREKKHKVAEQEWFRQIRQWRDWLDSHRADRVDEALQNIRAITDPSAATSVVKILENERDEDLRLLWMEVLAQIDHPAATAKLINLSLDEPTRDVRLQCLDYLLRAKRPIDITTYIKALHSRDNVVVNLAAEALGEIGDREAISPLIDALVTTHRIANPNAQRGNMSASFDGNGGAAFSAGGGPQTILRDFNNVEVRRALVKLSGGQDYDFNPQAWRRWFVNRQSQQVFVDPRRDE